MVTLLLVLLLYLNLFDVPQVNSHGQYADIDKSFTHDRHSFLLHGTPFQIIGGQMDPQRIPRPYWRQRLQMARAMGLNTIFANVFWDRLERRPGEWDFDGQNDVAEYFQLAQVEGLYVVLRPGPYVCAEHEWGGFPAWLSQIPGMVVRQNNSPFLNAARDYIGRLAQELRPLLVNNGGPILMAQLENEYGSFGSDKAYLDALAAILRENFDNILLYTNDGGGESYLAGGQLHGVLAETDGDARSGFAARDKYVTDPTSLGPLLDGEYYVTWIDNWAANYSHQTDAGDPDAMQEVFDDLDWILSNNNSFSLYMFHGGTNWGLDNGGIWDNDQQYLEAVTTSYDYGAPLDESGRPTDIYYGIRNVISKYAIEPIPDVPFTPNLTEIPEFRLAPTASLVDVLPSRIYSEHPLPMEALGQSHGFVLYEHVVRVHAVSGKITPGDGIRDRIIVYVNGRRSALLDCTYPAPATVHVSLHKGEVLQLLVENLGRVDYGPRLEDQRKGILGNVSISMANGTRAILTGWSMYSFQADNAPSSVPASSLSTMRPLNAAEEAHEYPVFYHGSFRVSKSCQTYQLGRDTFLSLPKGIKGIVWINGINIGRYWTIGPQQNLYLPGCFLKDGDDLNELVVLELEPPPTDDLFSARGIAIREWFNRPDPDAPGRS